jgi:uncharacterized protein YdcH (DUF465 family)
MNANELDDLIGHLENAKYVGASKAATMLRQQQDEIAKLTTQFVRVADENNRLKDKIEMLTKGKVEYVYDTTKTS